MSDIVEVTVNNWSDFVSDKRIKKASWLKLPASFLGDPKMVNLSPTAKLLWVYILCECARHNRDHIEISLRHARAYTQITTRSLRDHIFTLSDIGYLSQKHTKQTRLDKIRKDKEEIEPRTSQPAQPSASTGCSDSTLGGLVQEFQEIGEQYKTTFINTMLGVKARSRFDAQIKTADDCKDLKTAITNYKLFLEVENTKDVWRTPKRTLETFLGTKKSGFFWRQFIEYIPAPGNKQEEVSIW